MRGDKHGDVPFRTVHIHGLVRDAERQKMSKTKGNVMDPIEIIEKYGTDAVRMSLLMGTGAATDIVYKEDRLTTSRNFANKLWNSTRFVLMNLPQPKAYSLAALDRPRLELCDRWILAEYQRMLALVRQKLDAYDPAAAADVLYGFLWDKFCDWYVELAKIRLQGKDEPAQEVARAVLVEVLSGTLRMLHPFMPFITEELHEALKPFSGVKAGFVVQAGAPELPGDWSDAEACREMGTVMEVVTALRSLRAQLNVPPGLKIDVVSAGGSADVRELLAKRGDYLTALAHLRDIRHSREDARPAHSATAVAARTKRTAAVSFAIIAENQ